MSRYLAAGWPVISVDTKKKELVGDFKNGGREWQPEGQPEEVQVHDFPDRAVGKAIPYGVYDLGGHLGWVNVGVDHDTAGFAVEGIQAVVDRHGRGDYPEAGHLLISADGGGSNGYRVRVWKVELQAFADESGLEITVCHFPPGTSKWNKIEHRLFSLITMNWRGRPLRTYETVVNLIGNTSTTRGWSCVRLLIAVATPSAKCLRQGHGALNITKDDFHGDWNYLIRPNAGRQSQID